MCIRKYVLGGAARVFLLFVILFIVAVANANTSVKTYIPPKAFDYKEVIVSELDKYFPTIPDYNYIPALIEHESCISLTHSRCWKSTSELKSKREQGVGLGQITRAFKEDGSTRFDSLAGMRNQYKIALNEANWDTIKDRPDLQIRMIVLMNRDNYRALYEVPDPWARLHMTDSAYNGGLRDVHRARRGCNLAKDCDPNLWFGNTELYLTKSDKAIYGNRSPKMINRHHVSDVFKTRLPKYQLKYIDKGDSRGTN